VWLADLSGNRSFASLSGRGLRLFQIVGGGFNGPGFSAFKYHKSYFATTIRKLTAINVIDIAELFAIHDGDCLLGGDGVVNEEFDEVVLAVFLLVDDVKLQNPLVFFFQKLVSLYFAVSGICRDRSVYYANDNHAEKDEGKNVNNPEPCHRPLLYREFMEWTLMALFRMK
jgi:hypothetical protein